jgi:hypothetical protein
MPFSGKGFPPLIASSSGVEWFHDNVRPGAYMPYTLLSQVQNMRSAPVVLLRDCDGFTKEYDRPETFQQAISLPQIVSMDPIDVLNMTDPNHRMTIKKRQFFYRGTDQATGLPLYIEERGPLPAVTQKRQEQLPKPKRKLEA